MRKNIVQERSFAEWLSRYEHGVRPSVRVRREWKRTGRVEEEFFQGGRKADRCWFYVAGGRPVLDFGMATVYAEHVGASYWEGVTLVMEVEDVRCRIEVRVDMREYLDNEDRKAS